VPAAKYVGRKTVKIIAIAGTAIIFYKFFLAKLLQQAYKLSQANKTTF